MKTETMPTQPGAVGGSTDWLGRASKVEVSLLLFLETCAVDKGGKIVTTHMNAEDMEIAKRWNEEGFVSFGRIASEDISQYGSIPAVVRFVSAEPLLGHIAMRGHRPDWLIVGGESGPGSRDMEAGWVKDLRDESQAVGTKFFFKQWGGVDKKSAGRELAGRTWDELPDHATYAHEFGTDVAKHISSVLGAERETTAAVAGLRGGSAWEQTGGKAELSRAKMENAKLTD